jgi:hypothetical protein
MDSPNSRQFESKRGDLCQTGGILGILAVFDPLKSERRVPKPLKANEVCKSCVAFAGCTKRESGQ